MKLHVEVNIEFTLRDGHEVIAPKAVLDALASVRRTGSVRRAAEELDCSYRHLWGLLKRAEERLQAPMVLMERGRGAKLTTLGMALLDLRERAAVSLAAEFERIGAQAEAALSGYLGRKTGGVALRASHDLALEQLSQLGRRQGVELDLAFGGNMKNIAALAQDQCDLAGFHVPCGEVGKPMSDAIGRMLSATDFGVVLVMRRKQGLIVRPDNPRGITGIADLARPEVRFINRQRNAGTRMLLDQLLLQKHIAPSAIRGYADEEFTHFAVAALVAAGEADIGFGLEAAARKLKLGFIPIAQENYFLAGRKAVLESGAMEHLMGLLRSQAFDRICQELGGYDLGSIGVRREIDALHAE
jgi:molybdate transport repressor ModE-like protein